MINKYNVIVCDVCGNCLSSAEIKVNTSLCEWHHQLALNTPVQGDSLIDMIIKLLNYAQMKEDALASEFGDAPENVRERFKLLYKHRIHSAVPGCEYMSEVSQGG